MKLLKNEKGMTVVEVLVAAGMLAVLTFSFNELSKTQSNNQKSSKQDDIINATTRTISQALARKSSCDLILGNNPSTVNLGAIANLPTTGESSVNILGASGSTAGLSGIGVETSVITVILNYEKVETGGASKRVNQVVKALGQYNNGAFVGCIDAEEGSRREALKLVCEMVGGVFIDSGSGTESCDFTSMN